jgi:pimeloyl-ACP methyl ester carboxylesterase
MPHKKAQAKPIGLNQPKPAGLKRSAVPPIVSARWLLTAATIAIVGAAACAWLTLCLLFWQGSWQLLYHPASAITRTPASVGLAFDSVAFATTEASEPRLKGWWIPSEPGAQYRRFTVLYLHGQSGNLGDSVDDLAALRTVGVNILAFDYRGFGQSQFAHPSEARWREDAEWALQYLTATRHVAAGSIVLDGKGLGANLALEVAAAHPELAGVVLESPLQSPVDALFNDPRARLVPAHLLVRDHFNAEDAASTLLIPSLWLMTTPRSNTPASDMPASSTPASSKIAGQTQHPDGYDRITARKTLVWLQPGTHEFGANRDEAFAEAFRRWLDDLSGRIGAP